MKQKTTIIFFPVPGIKFYRGSFAWRQKKNYSGLLNRGIFIVVFCIRAKKNLWLAWFNFGHPAKPKIKFYIVLQIESLVSWNSKVEPSWCSVCGQWEIYLGLLDRDMGNIYSCLLDGDKKIYSSRLMTTRKLFPRFTKPYGLHQCACDLLHKTRRKIFI